MGARNTKASQSPLHSEIEALIWAMECMRNLKQFSIGLFLVGEDGFRTRRMTSFCKLLRRHIKVLKRKFNSLELIHVPRTHSSRAESVARSARKQSSFVIHMDA